MIIIFFSIYFFLISTGVYLLIFLNFLIFSSFIISLFELYSPIFLFFSSGIIFPSSSLLHFYSMHRTSLSYLVFPSLFSLYISSTIFFFCPVMVFSAQFFSFLFLQHILPLSSRHLICVLAIFNFLHSPFSIFLFPYFLSLPLSVLLAPHPFFHFLRSSIFIPFSIPFIFPPLFCFLLSSSFHVRIFFFSGFVSDVFFFPSMGDQPPPSLICTSLCLFIFLSSPHR